MPLVDFDTLPDDARVWVFGSDCLLNDAQRVTLLSTVDDYLGQWKAHGAPLTCARDWRHHRFLTIAVDQRSAGASGCSIDGLFRAVQGIESKLGASLVGGGRMFYRTRNGDVNAVDRDEFSGLAERGAISRETTVFDPTVTTLGDWRARFETTAGESWHAAILNARSGKTTAGIDE